MKPNKHFYYSVILSILITWIVFFFDIHTPFGWVAWVFYLYPFILLAQFSATVLYIYELAALITVLTYTGHFLIPPGFTTKVDILDRTLYVIVSWVFAYLMAQKKRASDELLESKNKLEESNRSKDKFFSIISHDLKGSFVGSLGFSEILHDDFDTLSETEKKYFIGELYSNIKHQFRLLENLLDWSRMQLGRMDYNPMEVNLREAVAAVCELLGVNARSKGVSMINEVPEELLVKADPNMLKSVLQNLIANGIKFTEGEGRIEISATEENGNAIITVSDTGVGIPDNVLAKLFDIDVKHSSTGTAGESGTGLGLTLCRELIQKNNGTISVESTPGEGSRFCFTLKAVTGDKVASEYSPV